MGKAFSRRLTRRKSKDCNVLIVDLARSRSRSLLYQLERSVIRVSSLGLTFDQTRIQHGGVPFILLATKLSDNNDLDPNSGDLDEADHPLDLDRARRYMYHFSKGSDCLVFVVDSCNVGQLTSARRLLKVVLQETTAVGTPLVIFDHRKDPKCGMTSAEVTSRLGIDTVTGRSWWVTTSDDGVWNGLTRGLDWIIGVLKPPAGMIDSC